MSNALTPLGLPGKSTCSNGYVYAIETDRGVVKVGMTMNPSKRLTQLARETRSQGGEIIKRWISPEHHMPEVTERALIFHCSARGESLSAEYFRGLDFESVKAFASGLNFPIPVNREVTHESSPTAEWIDKNPLTCMSLINQVIKGKLVLLDTATGEQVTAVPRYEGTLGQHNVTMAKIAALKFVKDLIPVDVLESAARQITSEALNR